MNAGEDENEEVTDFYDFNDWEEPPACLDTAIINQTSAGGVL